MSAKRWEAESYKNPQFIVSTYVNLYYKLLVCINWSEPNLPNWT